jgi:hypothetical protein
MASDQNHDSPEPENRSAEEALQRFEREGRDEYGRFRAGHSGNPGGIPKKALEARRAYCDHLPEAVRRTRALLESDNAADWPFAIATVNARALGKESAPADLPDDTPPPPKGECSPASLLGRALSLIERNIARGEQQMDGGLPISETERASLREDISTLAALLKAEQDAAKSKQPGAELSDVELKAKVLGAMTAEDLAAELSKRGAGT